MASLRSRAPLLALIVLVDILSLSSIVAARPVSLGDGHPKDADTPAPATTNVAPQGIPDAPGYPSITGSNYAGNSISNNGGIFVTTRPGPGDTNGNPGPGPGEDPPSNNDSVNNLIASFFAGDPSNANTGPGTGTPNATSRLPKRGDSPPPANGGNGKDSDTNSGASNNGTGTTSNNNGVNTGSTNTGSGSSVNIDTGTHIAPSKDNGPIGNLVDKITSLI